MTPLEALRANVEARRIKHTSQRTVGDVRIGIAATAQADEDEMVLILLDNAIKEQKVYNEKLIAVHAQLIDAYTCAYKKDIQRHVIDALKIMNEICPECKDSGYSGPER